jgi:hypothetical protein
MLFFISQLVPIMAIISSAVLAFHNIPGWGWFLFVAFFLSSADTVQKHLSK